MFGVLLSADLFCSTDLGGDPLRWPWLMVSGLLFASAGTGVLCGYLHRKDGRSAVALVTIAVLAPALWFFGLRTLDMRLIRATDHATEGSGLDR
jgi:hypothetical protein